MKAPPQGWPRIASSLFYEGANAAIAWLVRAFGFTVQLKVDGPDGRVLHSQLRYGDGLVMVGEGGQERRERFGIPLSSPRACGGANTQMLMLYVDDALAHCEQARAAGARIVQEPSVQDYGPEYWADRCYGALDPDGHLWWFCERVRDPV
jgi:uncharacterized glyoxalase superfamily protein PhnB